MVSVLMHWWNAPLWETWYFLGPWNECFITLEDVKKPTIHSFYISITSIQLPILAVNRTSLMPRLITGQHWPSDSSIYLIILNATWCDVVQQQWKLWASRLTEIRATIKYGPNSRNYPKLLQWAWLTYSQSEMQMINMLWTNHDQAPSLMAYKWQKSR